MTYPVADEVGKSAGPPLSAPVVIVAGRDQDKHTGYASTMLAVCWNNVNRSRGARYTNTKGSTENGR